MAKKNNGDKSLEMSTDFFNTLRLVTEDTISSIFGYDTAFFVIETIKNKRVLIRTITIDRQHFKGSYKYRFYWDSGFSNCIVKFTANESDDDFKARLDGYKKLIKEEMSKNRLYGRKIERELAD